MKNAATDGSHWGTLLVLLSLAGCGGGGSNGNSSAVAAPPTAPLSDFEAGVFQPSSNFQAMCETPRVGDFPDSQGSTTDENNWLRSWSNELYLWYDEIVDEDPELFTTPEYFDLMKTFATTPSGAEKDRFHFTIPTAEWTALSQSGVSAGYGAEFVVVSGAPPREVVVAFTDPNTPAAQASLARGARILEVDGADVAFSDDVDTLNNGFFPSAPGQSHTFLVRDLGAASTRTITLVAESVTADPVQFERVIDTPSGPVGYLFFSTHIATAEKQLIDAVTFLAAQSITDLVLDLRYNGGGFLDIANELAYMIAGPSAASGRTFSELVFNDQHPVTNPVTGAALAPEPFHETTQGFSTDAGEPLPSLNLPRVFVLGGPGTCSASESIINGLRGIDVEVILIGGTTCGKPYGTYAFDNCGTSYFSIQFGSVNAKGFGDYGDGFSPANLSQAPGIRLPGCGVADDYNSALGDSNEARLAAALSYRATATCPAASAVTQNLLTASKPIRVEAKAGPALAGRGMPGRVQVR
jgi:hypothetical protein